MTANELRIGNFINELDAPKSFAKVARIMGNDGILTDIGCAWRYDEVKPIPITPGLLLDFGFENWGKKPGDTEWAVETEYVLHNAVDGTSDFKVVRTKYSFQNGDTSIHWGIRIDQDDIYVRHLDYIHQLQNVFHSLIGYDLTPEFSSAKP